MGVYEMLKIAKEQNSIEAIKFAKTKLSVPVVKNSGGGGSDLNESVHQEQCHELLKTAMGFIAFQKNNAQKNKDDMFSYKDLREIFQSEFARLYKVDNSCGNLHISPFQRVCMAGL